MQTCIFWLELINANHCNVTGLLQWKAKHPSGNAWDGNMFDVVAQTKRQNIFITCSEQVGAFAMNVNVWSIYMDHIAILASQTLVSLCIDQAVPIFLA